MANLYTRAQQKAWNGEINWMGHTIKVMLLSSAYVPNQDTHDYVDDVVANEVSGTGYTAGGITLTGKTNAIDDATNTVKLDANDVSWANSNITARYAVVYSDAGATNATKALIAYGDLGERSSSNGAFDLTFGADGVVTLTAV